MEEKEKQEKPAEEVKKKSPMLLTIIIVIAALLVGGGGAVTFLMLKSKGKTTAEKTPEKAPEKASAKQNKIGPIHMLEPFIVNLAGTGKNYLKVEIGLELSDEKLKNEVENKLPQIKDSILLLLTSKTFEAVQSSEGKLALKNEIQTRLNTFISSGAIKNIYFTNFVVQ